MKHYLLFFFVFFLSLAPCFAQQVRFDGLLRADELCVDKELIISDELYDIEKESWNELIDTDKEITSNGHVLFEIDPYFFKTGLASKIHIEIEATFFTKLEQRQEIIDLEIFTTNRRYENYQHLYQFQDAFAVNFKVISIDYSVLDNNTNDYVAAQPNEINDINKYLRLESVLEINRHFKTKPGAFDPPVGPVLQNAGQVNLELIDNVCPGQSTKAKITWAYEASAISYELEYTFYEFLSEVGKQHTASSQNYISGTSFHDLFKNNATRLSTTSNNVNIQLIYPKGYLYYRVRSVSQDFVNDQVLYGQWSDPSAASGTVTTLNSSGQPIAYQIFNHCFLFIDNQALNELSWAVQTEFAEDAKQTTKVMYADDLGRVMQEQAVSYANDTRIVSEKIYDGFGREFISIIPYPEDACKSTSLMYLPDLHNKQGTNITLTWKDFDNSQCNTNPMLATEKGASNYYSPLNPTTQIHKDFIPNALGYVYSMTKYENNPNSRPIIQSGFGQAFSMGSGRETKSFFGVPTQIELTRLFGSEAGNALHYQKNMVIDPNGQAAFTYLNSKGQTIATSLVGANPVNLMPIEWSEQDLAQKNIRHNNVFGEDEVTATYDLMVPQTGQVRFDYELYPEHNESYVGICEDNTLCYDCPYTITLSITPAGCLDAGESLTLPVLPHVANFTYGQIIDAACNQNSLIDWEYSVTLPRGLYRITKRLTINKQQVELFADHYMATVNEECLPDLQTIVAGLNAEYSDEILDCERAHEVGDISCQVIRTMLLNDVMPGGKYFSEQPQGNGYNVSQQSIFQGLTGYDPATVVLEDGQITTVQTLSQAQFIQHFQMSWAQVLVKAHPEYCMFSSCMDAVEAPTSVLGASQAFDEALKNATYVNANPVFKSSLLGILNADPFFVSLNGSQQEGQYLEQMTNLLEGDFQYTTSTYANLVPQNYFTQALFAITQNTDYATNPALDINLTGINLCNADKEHLWDLVVEIYLGYKNRVKQYAVSQGVYLGFEAPCKGIMASFALDQNNIFGESSIPSIPEETLYTVAPDSDNEPNVPVDDVVNYVNDEIASLSNEFDFSPCDAAVSAWEAAYSPCIAYYEDLSGYEFDAAFNIVFTNYCLGQLAEVQTALDAVNSPYDADQAFMLYPNSFVDFNELSLLIAAIDQSDGIVPTPPNNGNTLDPNPTITDWYGNINVCLEQCNVSNITWPGTQNHSSFLTPSLVGTPGDCLSNGSNTCLPISPALPYQKTTTVCERLQQWKVKYSSLPSATYTLYPNLLKYINSHSDIDLSQDDFNMLMSFCNIVGSAATCNTCTYLEHPVTIPPALEAETRCQPCEVVYYEWNTSCVSNPSNELRAKKLNGKYGFNLSVEDYLAFLSSCNAAGFTPVSLTAAPIEKERYCDVTNSYLFLCPKDNRSTEENAEIDCSASIISYINVEAQVLYQEMLDNIKQEFIDNMMAHCLDQAKNDEFTEETEWKEHHFTLYYYDQAGNLVKTVPPAGVELLSDTDINSVIYNGAYKIPEHRKATKYWYTSLNQVYKQFSPDAGMVRTWFDELGRPLAGRTASQEQIGRASYTRYDALGRVFEGGECEGSYLDNQDPFLRKAEDLNQVLVNEVLIFFNNISSRFSVSRSIYDEYLVNSSNLSDQLGDNTLLNERGRITAALFFEQLGPISNNMNFNAYNYATLYAYDITGNVKTLVQKYRSAMPSPNQTMMWVVLEKRMTYDYDLVSGKVNEVIYQEGQPDEYHYRYRYDADNRLIQAQTSKNGSNWDTDARYEYYKHGPLARKVLGSESVQGVDYAYTLQGWLKSINAPRIDRDLDMGHDGYENNPNPLAINRPSRNIDAFSMTLGYYKDDYVGIGGDVLDLPNAYESSDFGTAANNLYNGNIRHATYQMLSGNSDMQNEVMGYAYKYDQLQRLKGMRSWSGATNPIPGEPKFGIWNDAILGGYQNEYSFDADGNIETQRRQVRLPDEDEAWTAEWADDMAYIYEDQAANHNRLQRVDDMDPVYGPYRYEAGNNGLFLYDASGRLIEDQKEYLTVDWYAFDKPKSVTKGIASGGSVTTAYLYDALHNRVVKSSEKNGQFQKTAYIRDASGNIMAVYEYQDGVWRWTEQHLYGAERLGVHYTGEDWDAAVSNAAITPVAGTTTSANGLFYETNPNVFGMSQPAFKGRKNYELTNHLGNVMAVVSDKLTKFNVIAQGVIPYSLPNMVSATDYDPFGMAMEMRDWQYSGVEEYSFSFNGKIEDPEILDRGRWQDYGFRAYRPDLGRFVSVDPLNGDYPELTTYQFASNCPIAGVDLDGLEFYYAADGKFLGQGSDKKSKVVYLAKAAGPNKVSAIDLNGKPASEFVTISNDHDDFVALAAAAYAESSAAFENGPVIPFEIFGIACAIRNYKRNNNTKTYAKAADANGVLAVGNKAHDNFMSNNPSQRNNAEGMQRGVQAAIVAMIGTKDYANGAEKWDGTDAGMSGRKWSEGAMFTEPSHDIFGLGNNPKYYSYPWKNSKGKLTDCLQKQWTYKWETTAAYSAPGKDGKTYGTIFYRLTEEAKRTIPNIPCQTEK